MKLNIKKINDWIAKNGPHGREALSFKSGLGFYTIGRLLKKEKLASKSQILALSHATGIAHEELIEA
jgi:hypothetical protein